ncbi:MAG: MBOAT family protein [Bacteroidota bacterium]
MVFSSAIFLFYFFPVFLLVYLASPVRYKNAVALMGSLLFYLWGAPKFIVLLLASITVDFYLGNGIYYTENKRVRRQLLGLGVTLNVALLAYFKYANFFVANFNRGLQEIGFSAVEWTAVALPIGISFFTFQKLSYLIDLYYRKAEPLERLANYALYIILFPQLIAGPIVRFKEIADQIRERRANLTTDNQLNGIFRFVVGLSKKVLIADTLGQQVDLAFSNGLVEMGTYDAWIILLAYAMQIYYDFSGYSDMAIGIGLMLGFRLPENFNFPYISRSITEFWRRWHITLSNWMRDYLYIPLGGNRKGVYRTYFNLVVVFLISGLWHGAAWSFVFWGAFHGTFLILDRLFLQRVLDRIGLLPALLFTFFVTLLGWVLFRTESLSLSIDYYQLLFAGEASSLVMNKQFWFTLFLASGIAIIPGLLRQEERLNNVFQSTDTRSTLTKAFLSLILLVLCFSQVEVSNFNPFIYFRF